METKVQKFNNDFPNRNWSPSSLNKLLTKLHQTSRGLLWIANPALVKSVRRGLLRTLIQLRSSYKVKKIPGHSQTLRHIQETGIPNTSEHGIEAAVL